MSPALPKISPVVVKRRPEAFNHPDWVFELKYDGFRSVAYISDGECRLVSRNGNRFRSFDDLGSFVAEEIRCNDAILDGELVCLDEQNRPNFNDLFYRRGKAYLYGFDLLWLNGRDLRKLPLIERKKLLRQIIPHSSRSRLRYLDHVSGRGVRLFDSACELDLEGIVAKRADGLYTQEANWLKVRNRSYSQWPGRDEMFDKEPIAEAPLWDKCAAACAPTRLANRIRYLPSRRFTRTTDGHAVRPGLECSS